MYGWTFVECGCCGGYHLSDYAGDCRNDEERFSSEWEDGKEIMVSARGGRKIVAETVITLDEQMEDSDLCAQGLHACVDCMGCWADR